MTIWDDIQAETVNVPTRLLSKEEVIEVMNLGVLLVPTMCVFGQEATRLILVKLAAVAVHGIEIIDAEIEADADDEIPF